MTTIGVFAAIFDELPQPIHAGTERRIRDTFEGLVGVMRVFEDKI